MSTSTISANFAQATRKVGDRSVTYTWRSPSQNIEFDGEQVGGLVKLNISHDSDRKQFSAFIRFAHYDRSRGFEVVKFAIFDNDNYPSGTVASQPIARYSAKALGEFETRVVNYLTHGVHGGSESVHQAWNRATLIAMGGNGTEGWA
jgi:hypothetical protein